MYRIELANKKVFSGDLSRIPKKEQDIILQKIEELKIYGIQFTQVKKLNNYKLADYRMRVGNYRILLDFDSKNNEIILFRILHRSKLY